MSMDEIYFDHKGNVYRTGPRQRPAYAEYDDEERAFRSHRREVRLRNARQKPYRRREPGSLRGE